MNRLIIHRPQLGGSQLTCSYTAAGQTYLISFSFGRRLSPADPIQQRLINWLAVVHALYIYDVAYFTELQLEFGLSQVEKAFFEQLIFLGMAEFRLVNHLTLSLPTTIICSTIKLTTPLSPKLAGNLVLNGGGKDSFVSAALLTQAQQTFAWYLQNTSVAQQRVVAASGQPAIIMQRTMDKRRKLGPLKGHRPTSAAIAISAVLTAYLQGRQFVVASNEQSSNEGNAVVDNVSINHQYSKSFQFEADFADLLLQTGIGVRYFSLLRPLHELQIAALAAQQDAYLTEFTSCNHGYGQGRWCLACAKCAFIVLVFTAVKPSVVPRIWGNPLVLAQPAIRPHLSALLDPAQTKPLECVGTLEECQLAALMILQGPLAPSLPNDLRQLLQTHTRLGAYGQLYKVYFEDLAAQHALPVSFEPVLGLMRAQLAQLANPPEGKSHAG